MSALLPSGDPTGTAARLRLRLAAPRRLAAVALLAAVIVVPSVLVIWLRASEPSDKTLILPASSDWTAEGVRLERVVAPSPLRVGDRILGVDGARLADRVSGPPPRKLRPGDRVRYLLRRDGTQFEVDVVIASYPFAHVLWENAAVLPFIAVFCAVTGVVFLRDPGAAPGRALLAVAGLAIAGRTTWPFGLQVVDLAGGRGVWPYVLGDLANVGVWSVLLHFALVLPRDRPLLRAHPRRTLAAGYALSWLLYAGWAAHALLTTNDPLARLGRLVAVSTPTAAIYPALIVTVLIAGWQRVADPADRARLRWVASGLAVSALLYLGLGQVPNLVAGGPLVPWKWQLLGFLVSPLAISWAIVRYQLFDIEAVLRRSVVYAALTFAVFIVYLLVFRLLVGELQQRQRWIALASSVLLVAVVSPAHNRLHALVGRALFGLRDNPAAVAAALRQLDPTGSPSAVLERVAVALTRTLRLSYAAVELAGRDDRFQLVASAGRPTSLASEIPIARGGEVVGRLLLASGPHREPFGSADARLLDEVGHVVSNFATSALLAEELLRARRRLVMAQEEERRRLRRDLHDRINPRLAGIAMQLEAARAHTGDNVGRIAELLEVQATAAGDVRSVAEEIGQAVERLRPRVLDARGLYRALQTRTSNVYRIDPADGRPHGLPVTVEVDGELGELPAAVDSAAFDIVIEAVNNVAKHAQASRCTIRLSRCQNPGELRVEIYDDGRGLPADYTPGVGLRSMRLRAEELQGSCTATRATPTGTLVRACLPIDEP